jgi:large subunit ribosomal protein L24e
VISVKCSFCGADIPVGTGVLQAYKDGSLYPLCSRKCEVNMLVLGRKPQKAKWTHRYHEEKAIRVHGGEKADVVEKVVEKVIRKGARADRKAKREARRAEKKKEKTAHKKAKAEGKATPKKEGPVEATTE